MGGLSGIAYGNGQFVAVGDAGSIITSPDGLSWTRRPSGTVRPLEGPGPRATPTIANGGLFVTGATGMFLRLDPAPGAILGQQVLKSVAGRAVPMWGFAASPLVTGSVAIVYAGGPGDKALSAASAPLRRDTGIPQTFLRKRQHPATALHKQCNGDMHLASGEIGKLKTSL